MKESTLITMKHDLGKLVQGLHNVIRDVVRINTMVVGMHETIKNMPGYDDAIQKLKDQEAKVVEEESIKKVADMVEEELDGE